MSAMAGPRRLIVTVCAMSASVMQTLDSTIANVALPNMQGSMSASLDQINWVLTSYIVSAAIMTAPVGWLAQRFGRKRLFVFWTVSFTLASVLCGLAQNLTQLVGFRILQGCFGAALIPLAQSVMIDIYPPHEQPKAQSIFGMGIMLGPIMGPTLGAWLTDNYSWHWVFLINLPFGIIAATGLAVFMDETKPNPNLKFDWFGFAALGVGIGALQLALDRGEQAGWFESYEIIAEFIIAAFGIYYFLAHSLTTKEPFIRFEIFRDRNFASACIFMAVMAVVLFGTMALVSPFLQQVGGYPVQSAGMVLSSRGVGTFFAMMSVRSLMFYVEARMMLMVGLVMTAVSLFMMSGFTNDTSASWIFTVGAFQGFAFGVVFVSTNTVAFLTLPPSLRTYGASFQTLVRNTSSSFGISIVISQLTQETHRAHAHLSEYITPFNDALKMPNVTQYLNLNTDAGRALTDSILNLQALVIGYGYVFSLVMIFAICALPACFVVGKTRATFVAKTARPPDSKPTGEPAE